MEKYRRNIKVTTDRSLETVLQGYTVTILEDPDIQRAREFLNEQDDITWKEKGVALEQLIEDFFYKWSVRLQ